MCIYKNARIKIMLTISFVLFYIEKSHQIQIYIFISVCTITLEFTFYFSVPFPFALFLTFYVVFLLLLLPFEIYTYVSIIYKAIRKIKKNAQFENEQNQNGVENIVLHIFRQQPKMPLFV